MISAEESNNGHCLPRHQNATLPTQRICLDSTIFQKYDFTIVY
jgi:hypothetical protein